MKVSELILVSIISFSLGCNVKKLINPSKGNHGCYEQLEKIKSLESDISQKNKEFQTMDEEVKRLSEENNIFTSMFGEIETEPGGHEILEKLFNKFKDE
tara:strand:+ start:47 stop:343 length:297 start_codon:yes stop_codon:yes gene_type:complete